MYFIRVVNEDYPVNKVLATLKPLKDYVGAIERASNNDIVWVLVNAYPEFDDNVLKHVVVTFIDITKIKNSEKLLHEVTILAKAGGWELNLITNTLLLTDVAKKIHELPLDEEPTIAEAINFYKEGYSRNMLIRILEDAREKGISFDYELQIVTSKGNECWVRIIGKPEFVQQKCVKLCGVIQDIHEKKLAEIALEKTKQEYKALFDENPDAVFSLDLEGNIIAANKGTADLVETTPEELMANHFGKYSDPEEIEKVKYHFEQVKKGIPQSFEANLITATGHKKVVSLINVPVIVNNEIIAISGISKDITARKEADIKLLQAKEMIEASLHELEHQKFALDQHAIVDIRDDKGKIIYVNDNFCAMSGYSREELIGNSYTLINSNYHPQSFFEEINKTIYSGQVWNGEICKKSKNGNLYWLRTTIVPFKNGSTLKPKQFISIRSDITKEVEANKTIRESNERFEYVTKATFDAIWEWNLITNDFYRGQGFETLFGYNYKDDISLKMSWDEIHPDDKERVIASVQEACNGKDNLWRQEFRFLKSNGEYANVVDKAVIVRDENGKAQRIIGAMQDITKTKERAEQMRLLESVVTNSNDMIIITEVDPLNEPGPRIIYVNEAFTKITGYTNDEVIGKTPRILQGEKTDKTILHDLRQKMDKWEITEVEVINYKKNGEEFWNNFTVVPIANKQGWFTHWIAIERDITERKKAELQLKASEERNRTIIQEAFDAMIINDLDNCIIEASPAIERLLGYTPHELIGKMCLNFIRKDFIPKIVDLIAFIIQIPEKEASIDALIRKKNGDYIWVEIKGKNMYHNKHINGMIVLLRDITSRKDAEDIVSLSEQRFKGLVQSGADIISIIDEEGVVKYSSPTVINILGNNPLTDIGKNVFDFVHKDDRGWTRATFDKMLTDGTRNMYFGPYRFPNAKKEYRWLETVVTNLTDDPAIKGIVINSRDVTETKRLNEEQKSLTEELVKNNLDLQQFSFITSHNLRAPVANLMSLLSLYDKVNVEEPFNKILIEKFEESTLQLNSTLNDLLEVLVLKSNTNIQIEPLSLTAIAKQVKMNIENLLIEQEGALDLNFTEIDEIYFNRLHLESVFLNLISNAIKYHSKERKLFIKITSKKVNML